MNSSEMEFWSQRYIDGKTGWDIGSPSQPLKTYIDQLDNKDLRILIPGAGNAYEAEYLNSNGFKNVEVLDISPIPLAKIKKRAPNFPKKKLIHGDFFEHKGEYDLIFEQTFFCSFLPTPENRMRYAQKMSELLRVNGKLVGLWFDIPLINNSDKRPFGGTQDEYLRYLSSFFKVQTFTRCYNSIEDRKGSELFGIFVKKVIF